MRIESDPKLWPAEAGRIADKARQAQATYATTQEQRTLQVRFPLNAVRHSLLSMQGAGMSQQGCCRRPLPCRGWLSRFEEENSTQANPSGAVSVVVLNQGHECMCRRRQPTTSVRPRATQRSKPRCPSMSVSGASTCGATRRSWQSWDSLLLHRCGLTSMVRIGSASYDFWLLL